jgi:Fe-S-cluster containining protein
MFSPALEKQRQQLFAHTVNGMARRLAVVDEPGKMFTALRWGLDELERTLAETPARVRATVACRAGCGYCCSVPVDVQAHEVFFAAEHIQVNFSPVALAAVIERTAAHRAKIAALTSDERAGLMKPCPLLSAEGSCTIYEGRPEICRAHHASDASVCAASQQPGDFERVHIPALKARMFAVMLGLDEAIESAGFDHRAYDLGSALHEALTNSLCLARWLRHQPAFPDSCLADRSA